jgi:FtsZ-interacting cell division protein ZipA
MPVGAIVAIVVVLVIIAVVAAWAARRRGVGGLTDRKQFGPEYTRMANEVGAKKANAEFDKRQHRVEGLGIKPLSAERRDQYETQWLAVQETFIDNPQTSVRNAASLISAVAADRGYEVADAEQFRTDLSVHHGRHLDGYRGALAVSQHAETAKTEELRQALLDYRSMFQELTEVKDAGETGIGTTTATAPRTAAEADMPVTAKEVADDESHHHGRVFWRRDTTDAAPSRR